MKLFFKGLIIGIGKILPGISGSVLAISLGEYQNIIFKLSKFYQKDNMNYLIKIFIGILISIVFFSKFLFVIYTKYPLYSMALFSGLIIGTIPNMSRKINDCNIIYILIGFVIVLFLTMKKINYNFNKITSGIIIGLIESVSTIIPGVSGTALLTNFNLYNSYLLIWSHIWDYRIIFNEISFYFSFFVSLIISSIFLIMLVKFFFSKNENKANGLILGFTLSSVFIILKKVLPLCIISKHIILFVLYCIIGFIIGFIIDKQSA